MLLDLDGSSGTQDAHMAFEQEDQQKPNIRRRPRNPETAIDKTPGQED